MFGDSLQAVSNDSGLRLGLKTNLLTQVPHKTGVFSLHKCIN